MAVSTSHIILHTLMALTMMTPVCMAWHASRKCPGQMLKAGSDCTRTPEYCMEGTVCQRGRRPFTCKTGRSLGQSCNDIATQICDSGLDCDMTVNQCKTVRYLGESCNVTIAQICDGGLACDATADQCITDPCVPGQHTEVDDVSRSVDNGEGYNCDDTLFGWHRFMLNGANARIPISCAPVAGGHRCGGMGSLWVNLQDQSLPSAGQQLDAVVCSSFMDICCEPGLVDITVRNCGQFFIYNLQGTFYCNDVYCVEPQP